MLIPSGQILHKDLNTTFTRFDKLLLVLKESRFSGYIRINFWEYESLIIWDVGRILQAFVMEKGKFILGMEALKSLLPKIESEEGSIDVHSLPNEVAISIASVLGSGLLADLKNQTGDAIAELLSKLEKEEVTGYIDFDFSNKKGKGSIYLLDGIPIEAVILSATGSILSGENVLQKFLTPNNSLTADVKIYSNPQQNKFPDTEILMIPEQSRDILLFWERVIRALDVHLQEILKRDNFLKVWTQYQNKIGDKFPLLHPSKGAVIWDGESFQQKKLTLISEFNQTMLRVLEQLVWSIPLKKRKKIQIGKVMETLLNGQPPLHIPSDYLKPLPILESIILGDAK